MPGDDERRIIRRIMLERSLGDLGHGRTVAPSTASRIDVAGNSRRVDDSISGSFFPEGRTPEQKVVNAVRRYGRRRGLSLLRRYVSDYSDVGGLVSNDDREDEMTSILEAVNNYERGSSMRGER